MPESILKEIEDLGSGLSREERGETVKVTFSYAGLSERPSVPPDDLYSAPWRVVQRPEQQRLEEQERQKKQPPVPRITEEVRRIPKRQ